jgi:ADP-heptose:LPS heptosyltransferase
VIALNTLSLAEFGGLMQGAEFFVGIESFPAHLALAFKREIFCLVNNDSYYLKGFSRRRSVIDARSMLPIVSNIHFFDLKTAKAADILKDNRIK